MITGTTCDMIVYIYGSSTTYPLVVYRSSETSTNQSDVIIRSDDRFRFYSV